MVYFTTKQHFKIKNGAKCSSPTLLNTYCVQNVRISFN